MSKILGFVSVILFWMLAIVFLPIVIFGGSAVLLFYMIYATSAIVYEASTNYFRKKNL